MWVKIKELSNVTIVQSYVMLILSNVMIEPDNAWMISGLKLSSTLPKVASKPWNQRQIKGDRWRPAKNPPMIKLVSVINFEGKVFYRSSEWITLFVDQCFYSTPTKQSSPFMWINGFNSKLTIFNTVSFGQVHLTIVGNGSHQLCRLRKGVMSNVWFVLFTA